MKLKCLSIIFNMDLNKNKLIKNLFCTSYAYAYCLLHKHMILISKQ